METEEKLLGTDKSYFHEMTTSLLKKRDLEVKILRDAGFDPVIPDGGYFIMADTSKLGNMSYNLTSLSGALPGRTARDHAVRPKPCDSGLCT